MEPSHESVWLQLIKKDLSHIDQILLDQESIRRQVCKRLYFIRFQLPL